MLRALRLNPKSSWFKSLTVGVLFGGISSERKISIKSGKAVAKALSDAGFKVICIDPASPSKMRQLIKKIDVAFVALHGEGGEDGKIQTFLEKQGVAYTGSNPEGCFVSLDKELTKKRLIKHGLPTAPYEIWNSRNWMDRLNRRTRPLFIKPLREGSSIGAYSVESNDRAIAKVRQSIAKYRRVMAENAICGREFTVGVLDGQALPVIELRPKRAFYDFKAKYTKGMTRYVVPAKIPSSLARELKKLAVKTHKVLKLRDMSRIDFMVSESREPFILEANAIPGFTELSLLPKAAQNAGLSFKELCTMLVKLAYDRKLKNRL